MVNKDSKILDELRRHGKILTIEEYGKTERKNNHFKIRLYEDSDYLC